jgi:hypothetical protein
MNRCKPDFTPPSGQPAALDHRTVPAGSPTRADEGRVFCSAVLGGPLVSSLLNAWAPTGQRQLLVSQADTDSPHLAPVIAPSASKVSSIFRGLSWFWSRLLSVPTGPILSPPLLCPLHLLDSFRFPQLVLAINIVIVSICLASTISTPHIPCQAI